MLLVTIYFFIELLYIQLLISKSTTSATTKTLSNDIDSLVVLDILLLADGLVYFLLFICYHRLFHSYYHIIWHNATLFSLIICWLIIMLPTITVLKVFYTINVMIALSLILSDLKYFSSSIVMSKTKSLLRKLNTTTKRYLFSRKQPSSSGSVDYDEVYREASPVFDIEEDKRSDVVVSIDSVNDNDNDNSNKNNNNNNILNNPKYIKYMPKDLDITRKGLCDGFRINLNCISSTHPNIPQELEWDIFTDVKHLLDSSSCHIYRAFWGPIPVILKLIKEERLSSPVAVAEFDIEEAVLLRIAHPNIIRLLGELIFSVLLITLNIITVILIIIIIILGSGKKPRKYLVLEYLSGGTLSQSLGIRNDLSKQKFLKKFRMIDALKLAYGLSKALHYLHHEWSPVMHIIHRDVKPDNIGWSSDGVLKLFDFGLCVPVRMQRDPTEQFRMTGNTGTLRYMAPEVVLGRSYHKSVDAYSFGILIWQVASGKIPYQNMGKKTYFDKVVMGGMRPKLYPHWPVGFIELLKLCWHEDKNIRPTFYEIMAELSALIDEEENMLVNSASNITNKSRYSLSKVCSTSFVVKMAKLLFLITSMIVFILSFLTTAQAASSGHSQRIWAIVGSIAAGIMYLTSMSFIGSILSNHNIVTLPDSIYQQSYHHHFNSQLNHSSSNTDTTDLTIQQNKTTVTSVTNHHHHHPTISTRDNTHQQLRPKNSSSKNKRGIQGSIELRSILDHHHHEVDYIQINNPPSDSNSTLSSRPVHHPVLSSSVAYNPINSRDSHIF